MQEIWAAYGEWPVAYRMSEGFVSGVLHLPYLVDGRVPAVLFCHGFTGSRVENHRLFVTAARTLAAHGIAALRIDFRGSGESWGEFSMMTLETEVADALAGIAFLRQEPRIDPARIGLVGLSLGGCIGAIATGRAGDLKATALWAPVARPRTIFSRDLPPEQVERMLSEVGDHNGWPIGPGLVRSVLEVNPLREVRGAGGPVLLLHGTADRTVPLAESEAYAETLSSAGIIHKRVLVPEADHTFNRLDWTTQVVHESLAWFQEHL